MNILCCGNIDGVQVFFVEALVVNHVMQQPLPSPREKAQVITFQKL